MISTFIIDRAESIKNGTEKSITEKMDKRTKAAFNLASVHAREKLDLLLNEALDKENIENINLLLDAIKFRNEYDRLLELLARFAPKEDIENIKNYTKEIKRENNERSRYR